MKSMTSNGFVKKLSCEPSIGREHRFLDYFLIEIFLRPFWRRRFKTLLPAGVRFLTKKPWDFERFLFFGLYVNDIVEQLYIK